MTDRPIPDETMRRAEEVLDLMCCNVPEAGNVRQASILDIAHAILEAEKRGMRRGAEKVDAALKRYRAALGDIPLGHENQRRGASTYNWKVAVYEEIAAAILAELDGAA